MARIRSIHPGIFTDEAFMSASPYARLLIIGLWSEAFDDGVFEYKPLTIKARIYPVDNVDVGSLLNELESLNFFKSFDAVGKRYGAIRNFQKFQRPKKPNSSKVLPEHMLDYVGGKSEPVGDEYETSSEPVPNQFRTSGEKSPQMEDGGWRMEEIKDTSLRSVSKKNDDDEKPEPELFGNTETLAEAKPATKDRKIGTRIPKDWTPSQQDIDFAIENGFARSKIPKMRDEFVDFWVGVSGKAGVKLDWPATWRNNVRKLVDLRGNAKPRAQNSTTQHVANEREYSPEVWKDQMRNWRKTGEWLIAFGPVPGSRGCRVPREILEQFNTEQQRVSA